MEPQLAFQNEASPWSLLPPSAHRLLPSSPSPPPSDPVLQLHSLSLTAACLRFPPTYWGPQPASCNEHGSAIYCPSADGQPWLDGEQTISGAGDGRDSQTIGSTRVLGRLHRTTVRLCTEGDVFTLKAACRHIKQRTEENTPGSSQSMTSGWEIIFQSPV
ncbi:unnamed protein product [Gadus morhua 'NCC']